MTGVLQIMLARSSTAGGTLSATASGIAEATAYAPPNTQALTTNSVTVTPAGGSGSYTHSWAFVSGDNIFSISSSTAATVTWAVTATRVEKSAIWRDTVSDGTNTVTVDVDVSAVIL